LTISEAWTTSNVVSASVELQDTIVSGLKLALDGSILPAVGQRNARVGAEYKQDHIFLRTALDVFRGPTITSDLVVGADGVLVGGEVAYDVKSASVTKYNTALGYLAKDYAVTLHANNAFSIFSAAYWHRVSPELEAGAKAIWDRKVELSGVGLEVGTKLVLDKDTSVKAKINNIGILGLGYTQS
ncbi:Mitochondrial porin, partial [Gonapodya sp. JEL0774]